MCPPKFASFLNESVIKDLKVLQLTSLHCLLFSTSKNKDLKRISKSATSVVLALNFSGTQSLLLPSNVLKLTI